MNKQREYAKRLSHKETLALLEKAFLAGEKLGQENAKSIYWNSGHLKAKPIDGFNDWVKGRFKTLTTTK